MKTEKNILIAFILNLDFLVFEVFGRILNMAWAVSAGYTFGDHLAFALAFDSAFAMPMVVGKLISGVSAVILSAIVYRKSTER